MAAARFPPAVRTLAVALCLSAVTQAWAAPYRKLRPPERIDATTFSQLVDAVKAERFSDDKLGRLREVAGGRSYLFSGAQVLTLLPLFVYWLDRTAALRLLPLADREDAPAVLRYFEPAPALVRSEVRTLLSTPR